MAAAPKLLRVRIRCPSICPAPVSLEACTAETTFASFRTEVMKALGLKLPAASSSQAAGEEGVVSLPTILAGFPPRPLDLADDVAIGSVLSDNENITVRIADQSASGANPKGGSWGRSRKAQSTVAAAPAPSRRSTRASRPIPPSSASSDTGDTVDAANEEAAAAPEATRKSRAKAGKTSTNGISIGGSGVSGGVHTLSGPLAPSPARRQAGAASSSRGSGRGRGSGSSQPGQVRTLFGGRSGSRSDSRLGGGAAATATTASASSRKRVRPATGVALRSESDIGETLLRAVGGGGQGTADKFFRKAMKLAVDKQYDQSKADARVRAALGKWYTAEASAGQRRLADGESVALKVSFSKGDGAKSRFEEIVDRIPRAQVAAVVRMIARDPESREMLKPHNMAGCSPRMFWSLVEHWGGDVPAALRRAAPDMDWGFLEMRDRKPSEKAIANAITEEAERRQAAEEKAERAREKEAKQKKKERKRRKKEGIASESSGEEEEPASATTEPLPENETGSISTLVAAAEGNAVAYSEEELAAAAAAQARRRAVDAALSRLAVAQQGAAITDGTLAAAGEVDVDIEGLMEVVSGRESANLLVAAGVRTVGQLADRDEDELARELEALQATGVRSGGGGGDGSATGGEGVEAGEGGVKGMESEARVGAEKVAEWVEAARGEELDGIMFELVGSDDDVVEALEEVSVATPRDLVRLGAFPDILIEALRDKLGAERFASLEAKITSQTIVVWRRNGNRVIEQRPWLELWVSE